jgi:hypothetical protein
MAELHYSFIKNGVVENTAVFQNENKELADLIVKENGYDEAVWVGENPPIRFSTYDGKNFTPPTVDYLYEIGVANMNQAMIDEHLKAEAAKTNTVE